MLGVNTMSHGKSKDVIFSKLIKTILRQKDGDEEQRNLRVTVERDTGVGPVGQKVLNIVLTDDEDPYFVYDVCVSEEEYKPLKEQQNLLVDFSMFFEHVVRLFDQCMDGDGTRFSLLILCGGEKHLLGRGAQLQVMEVTNFKHLCHLSLPVSGGSDADVKKYMAQKIKTLQEEMKELRKELGCVQRSHDDNIKKLEAKSESCNQIVTKCMEEKAAIQSRLTQELIAEKEKYNKTIVEMQRNLELEKQCVEDKYQDIVRNLETQISSLKSQLQTSVEKNSQAEFANRELKKQVSDSQAECKNMLKELASVRKQNAELDGDYHEKERMVQSLRTRLAVIEQELKDKAVILVKIEEENQMVLVQKQRLEETLMEKEGSVQRLQSCLQTVSEDFVKANEILTLHQTELASVRTKLQLSTNIAFEQEKILEAKSKRVSELMEELDASRRRMKELEEEGKRMGESVDEMKKACADKDKRLKLSEDVIERLNRRLSESQEQAAPRSLWPLRYPIQRPLASGASSTIGHHSTSTGPLKYLPSTYGPNPKTLADRTMGPQMPAKSTPQLGFSSVSRNTSEGLSMTGAPNLEPSGRTGEIASAKDTAGSAQEQGTSSRGMVLDEAAKERKQPKSAASNAVPPADLPKASSAPRANAMMGGILRNPNPPPLSAYFHNSVEN